MTAVFSRIWSLLDATARREAATLFALMLLGSALEGLGIGLVFPVLSVVADPSAVEQNAWLAHSYEISGAQNQRSFLIEICFGLIVVFLAKNAVFLYITYFQTRFVWGQRARLSTFLLSSYVRSPLDLHLNRNSAEILRNVTVSVSEIFGGMVLPAVLLITESLVVIVIGLLLLFVAPLVTVAAGVVLGATGGLYYVAVRPYLKQWGSETQRTNATILRGATQAVKGIREVKLLGREEFFVRAFDTVMRRNTAARQKHAVTNQSPRFAIELIVIAAVLSGMIVILSRAASPMDYLATFGVFGMAAMRLMPSVNRITSQINTMRFNVPVLEAIATDVHRFKELAPGAEKAAVPLPFEQGIACRGVTYRFPGAARDVLRGIDLDIRRGESIGLVGPSGGGKSTLVDILMALKHPTAGRLLVDGREVTADEARSWQRHIGYVPQEPFFVDGTIAENVAFGIAPADIDRSRLRQALKNAQLDTVMDRLPQGADAPVGEDASRLSGGQRQRLSVARALYTGASLIVLDEATSSLDAETEAAVAATIDQLSGNRTLVIIAHRLSTVQHCDRLYYIEEGRIIAGGTFSQLVDSCPPFRRMAEHMRLTLEVAQA